MCIDVCSDESTLPGQCSCWEKTLTLKAALLQRGLFPALWVVHRPGRSASNNCLQRNSLLASFGRQRHS